VTHSRAVPRLSSSERELVGWSFLALPIRYDKSNTLYQLQPDTPSKYL